MTNATTSAAELLAKLRAGGFTGECEFKMRLNQADALSLLTAWRDEAVRAEREKIAANVESRELVRIHIDKGPKWTEETGILEVVNAHTRALAQDIRDPERHARERAAVEARIAARRAALQERPHE